MPRRPLRKAAAAAPSTELKEAVMSFCVVATAPLEETGDPETLTFGTGDLVEVHRWNKCGWWWGRRVADGAVGWFPSDQVAPMSSISAELPEPDASMLGDAGVDDPVLSDSDAAAEEGTPQQWPPVHPGLQAAGLEEAPPGDEQQAASAGHAQWPPLPPGPPPPPTAGSMASMCPAAWLPPLPPGPPPTGTAEGIAAEAALPPLPRGPPPPAVATAAKASKTDFDEYVQTMGFAADGRMARSRMDRDVAQLSAHFDYGRWVAARSKEPPHGEKRSVGRMTGDGGFRSRG